MAAGTRYDIVLAEPRRAHLRRLAVARRHSVREVRNAQILLLRSDRLPVRTVAVRLHCSTGTIAAVCRAECTGKRPERAREAAHHRPAGYATADREEACAWVQRSPQELGLPCTRWSLALAQQCWRRHRATPAPARSTFRRWFRAAGLPWWQIHTHCTPRDPAFVAKASAVCGAYTQAPAHWGLFCYDQKPQLQAISRAVPNRFAQPGRSGRCEHDYERHGTLEIHALLDVRSGVCQWAARDNHRAVAH